MRALGYSVVSSLMIAAGNQLLQLVEFAAPLYAIYVKLVSVFVLTYYFNQYLFPNKGLVDLMFGLSLSLLLSYLRVSVRNNKLKSIDQTQSHEFTPMSQFVVTYINLTLLLGGYLYLRSKNILLRTIYIRYYTLVFGFFVYRLFRLARQVSKQKSNNSMVVRIIGAYTIMEFLVDCLVCYYASEGSLLTILVLELYQIYLLFKYRSSLQDLQFERRNSFFLVVLCIVKTLLLYLEYYSLTDPAILIFNITGDLLSYYLICNQLPQNRNGAIEKNSL